MVYITRDRERKLLINMIKKFGKALPYALAGAIAFSSLTGCSDKEVIKEKKDVKNQGKYESSVSYDFDKSDEEVYSEAIKNYNDKHENEVAVTPSITPTVAPTPTPEESITPVVLDAYGHLDKVYIDKGLDVSKVHDMGDASIETKAAILYKYLGLFDLDFEEVQKELVNVMAAGAVDLCDFKSYNPLLFKALSSTIDEDTWVVHFYYPLALYVHLYDCKEEHIVDEYGRLSCPEIDKRVDELNFDEFYTGYTIEDVSHMGDDAPDKQAMNRILNTEGVDVNKAFKQLETIIIVCAIPTDYEEEEWNEMFSELLKTVGPYENVCDVYYDLALHYHGLNCDRDHEINEFDRLVCPQYKKYYR